jgi:hypothetical protein
VARADKRFLYQGGAVRVDVRCDETSTRARGETVKKARFAARACAHV